MKRIRIIAMPLVAVLITIFVGCGAIDYHSQSEEANKMLAALLIALENKDEQAVKALFATDLIENSSTIDEEIKIAMSYFDGKIVSYERVVGVSGGDEIREGKLTYSRVGNALTESVITDIETYEISFSAILLNEEKKTQEGLWRVWIGKKDGSYIVIGSDDYDL